MAGNLDLSGLDSISSLMTQPKSDAGAAWKIPVDKIDPDPDQPRRTFDDEALAELATSISVHGVLQPISVREHPEQAGRYIINQGERRWRAARKAELAEIPAFVADAQGKTLAAQVVENVQREGLSTREIVDAIARMKADGLKQAEIAKELGKSKAWVSKHAALVELPEPLAALLDAGRARDASTLYEALQCWKANQTAVETFLGELGDGPLVQAEVERWRASIERMRHSAGDDADVDSNEGTAPSPASSVAGAEKSDQDLDGDADSEGTAAEKTYSGTEASDPGNSEDGHDGGSAGLDNEQEENQDEKQQGIQPSKKQPDPDKYRKPLLQVKVGRREAILLPAKRAEYGLVVVQYEDGSEETIDALKVRLVAITEGNKSAG